MAGSQGWSELDAASARRGQAGPQGWTASRILTGWTVFSNTVHPRMSTARRIRSVWSRLGHLNPHERRPRQSRSAAGGHGHAVVRWHRRSSDLPTSPATVARGGTSPGRVRGGGAGGDQKMLALELARQARPQSLNSAWHRRRALPERVPAAALLQGVYSSLSSEDGGWNQRHADAKAVRRFKGCSNV